MKKALSFLTLSVLLLLILPAHNLGAFEPAAPPAAVKRYLADHRVLVSSSEIAVQNRQIYRKRSTVDELPALFQFYDITPGKDFGHGVRLVSATASDLSQIEEAAVQLGADIGPVLRSESSPLRVLPLREVVFRLHEGTTLDVVKPVLTAHTAGEPHWIRELQYIVDLGPDSGYWSSLDLAAALSELRGVDWAVPNCVREARKHYLPNDITNQWHLYNTNAVRWTNSAALPGAWNTTLGDPGVVIAIIDDGIQLDHPDLQDNIWLNPGEVPGDMTDNDGNGYVDDVNGWDFYNGTNIVNPTHPDESHGTALAGIAAGRGDNGLGISGAAPHCSLLPVKIWSGDNFVTDLQWAEAVTYAARHARILNLSVGSPDALGSQLVAAFDAASTSSLIFASSANDADLGVYLLDCDNSTDLYGWYGDSVPVAGAGPHTFRWLYEQDGSITWPSNGMWLDGVTLPDGQYFDFESGVWSNGWTSGGNANWFFSPESNDHMVVGRYSLRSGYVGNNESSWVQVTASGAGTLSYYYQVFGERTCDGALGPFNWDHFTLLIDGVTNWTDANENPEWWGEDFTMVQFPAALTSVIAVGASDVSGHRSTYSCFGTNLEIVAPSSGATDQTDIRTTDRTSTNGYNTTAGSAGDYDDTFGGTSGSAPLACGIAALLFSANPELTVIEARDIIRQSARKIGTVPYVSGFNERYGYGQIDAASAMHLMLSNMPPKIVRLDGNGNQFRMATVGIETTRNYTVYGASTLNGTSWQWTPITSDNGEPVWGTNWTPYIERTSTPPYRVYKIEK